MTFDEVKARGEKAKAWLPKHLCSRYSTVGLCEVPCGKCSYCLGAQQAVEWVIESVDDALRYLNNNAVHAEVMWREMAKSYANMAARIESLFGAPGPVSAFRDAVVEFCRA